MTTLSEDTQGSLNTQSSLKIQLWYEWVGSRMQVEVMKLLRFCQDMSSLFLNSGFLSSAKSFFSSWAGEGTNIWWLSNSTEECETSRVILPI